MAENDAGKDNVVSISQIVDKDSLPDDALDEKDMFPEEKSQISLDEMHTRVLMLCRQLDRNVVNGTFDSAMWVEQLRAYIVNPSKRLFYNDISNYIFSKNSKENGSMMTNLDAVMDYAVKRLSSKPKEEMLYKTVLKFYDHVNLARMQKEMFDSDRADLQKEIETEVKQEISNATKDVTSQLVGLVALFTAMSFIVFGGIASLDSIFKSANRFTKDMVSVLPVLIVAVAWAFCMMNLLFGFMYFVLRLVKPEQFSGDTNRNFVQRFPVVVLTNYILVMSLVLLGGMWFAKYNGIGLRVFTTVLGHPTLSFWAGILVFVAVFWVLGWKLWSLYLGKEKTTKQYKKAFEEIVKAFVIAMLAVCLHTIILAFF